MVDQARANFPELDFQVGSMGELDAADGSLSGVGQRTRPHGPPPSPRAVAALLEAAGLHVVMSTVFEPAGRPGAQMAGVIALRE